RSAWIGQFLRIELERGIERQNADVGGEEAEVGRPLSCCIDSEDIDAVHPQQDSIALNADVGIIGGKRPIRGEREGVIARLKDVLADSQLLRLDIEGSPPTDVLVLEIALEEKL